MENILTLELTDYNDSQETRNAQLAYTGNNPLTNQTKLWINKFFLCSQEFPLHIPTLSDTWDPYYGTFTTPDSLIVQNVPTNFFYTSWVITVSVGDTFYSAPVLWMKNGFKPPLPMDLNNDYFWVKNEQLICDMVTKTFNIMFPTGTFYFLKSGSSWIVAGQQSFIAGNVVNIYFNDAMKKCFNFNYRSNSGFIIPTLVTKSLNGLPYYVTETTSTNINLFPFTKLVFTGNGLPVPSVNFQNTASSVVTKTKNVILSYSMIVTDISQIGNTISFTTDSSDRSLTLLGNGEAELKDFTIDAFFVMRNGNTFPVKIGSGDLLEIQMQFL